MTQTAYALSQPFEQILGRHCGCAQEPFREDDLVRLARAVKVLADTYTDETAVLNLILDPVLRTAYSAYYLPCNAIKLFPILHEIIRHRSLPDRAGRLSVLDLGCGPGTLTAGLLDFCLQHCRPGAIRLDVTAIDRDPGNCAAARALIHSFADGAPGCPAVGSLHVLSGDVLRADACVHTSVHNGFDLILAGNLVNELDSSGFAAFARQLRALLNTNGLLIVIDPGTRRSFQKLLLLRNELLALDGISLLAPCLQAGVCPLQECASAWCHEKLFWSPPRLVRLIDQRTGFTKHKGVKFSYLVAARAVEGRCAAGHGSPAESLWRVVSYVIRAKGEERLYLCNGRERIQVRRLTRIRAAASANFSNTARGDIVIMAGAEPRSGFFDIGPAGMFRTVG